jgi:shikimate dehydrogenase
MRLFGLIGYPLSHSFSSGYFTQKFKNENIDDASYENFEIDSIQLFPGIINKHIQLVGLNVTIPYKQKIIPYLDELDRSAREVNAVNTIKICRLENGKSILKGYNTDIDGFRLAIQTHLRLDHKNALVLGTGGASKAVIHVLEKLGIRCQRVARTHSENIYKTYNELIPEDVKNFQIIVNTTPLGMYPTIDEYPQIPYEGIFPGQILFDLIYNPSETMFLRKGKLNGGIVVNGLEMLKIQAEQSWKIWNR